MKTEKTRVKRSPVVWGLAILLLAATAAVNPDRVEEPKRPGALVQAVERDGLYVELIFERATARVSRRGDGMIRVRMTDRPEFSSFPSFSVIPGEPEVAPLLTEDSEKVILEAGLLRAVVDKQTGTINFLDDRGRPVLVEPPEAGAFFRGEEVGCVKEALPREHYYGFGEKTGPLDKRGESMVMWTSDMPYNRKADPLYQAHPFFMGLRQGRAYGLFFDNTFKSEFDMAKTRPDRFRFSAAGGELDYWVIAGPSPAEVLERYGRLVGTMPLPPLWGLGYHQCRWSYENERQVRNLRDGFLKHEIPVDAIYLDIHYMDGYRVFTFDNKRFPDPAGLIAELKRDGIRTVVIVDPGVKVDPGYQVYDEGVANNYFARHKDGSFFMARVWPGDAYFPDFYRPEVQSWWGDWHQFYFDQGVEGIWNDMNEPAGAGSSFKIASYYIPTGPADWLSMRHGDPPVIPHARLHNLYALFMNQGTWEGFTKHRPDQRPFIITRSGFPGVQRTSLTWTGDNFATWGSMRVSVPMLLNMGLTGLAFVGSDIGGFGLAPTPELYARWIELGVFYPFARTHTANLMPPQEPWSFGKKVTDIARKHINLRYRLLPYTYALFEESTRTNAPVMRALVFEFPDDEAVTNLDDQFMWGKWLMVAPVMRGGRTSREVYFPAGTWFDVYAGTKIAGPVRLKVRAPLDRLPLFARGGAIIPLAPEMRYSTEKPWDHLTLMVFPDKEPSSFILYEDDKETMAYARGEFSRQKFECLPGPDGVKVMIHAPEGNYPVERKRITLRVYGQDSGAKVEAGPALLEKSYELWTGAWVVELNVEGRESLEVTISNPGK